MRLRARLERKRLPNTMAAHARTRRRKCGRRDAGHLIGPKGAPAERERAVRRRLHRSSKATSSSPPRAMGAARTSVLPLQRFLRPHRCPAIQRISRRRRPPGPGRRRFVPGRAPRSVRPSTASFARQSTSARRRRGHGQTTDHATASACTPQCSAVQCSTHARTHARTHRSPPPPTPPQRTRSHSYAETRAQQPRGGRP